MVCRQGHLQSLTSHTERGAAGSSGFDSHGRVATELPGSCFRKLAMPPMCRAVGVAHELLVEPSPLKNIIEPMRQQLLTCLGLFECSVQSCSSAKASARSVRAMFSEELSGYACRNLLPVQCKASPPGPCHSASGLAGPPFQP